MKLHVLLLFSSLISFYSMSQLKNETIEFGVITDSSPKYQDIRLTNNQKAKIYILRIEHSTEVSYKLSSDLLLPDSSVVLRVQVNPKKKGDFYYQLLLFPSNQNEPIQYIITGSVPNPLTASNNLTQCPDFNQSPPNSANRDKKITIITIDKETKERLSSSKVSIIHNGIPAGSWITGSSGSFKDNFPPGYFYFLVSHDGYLTKEEGVYVNPEISEITIPLVRTAPRDVKIPEEVFAEVAPIKLPEEQAVVEVEKQLVPEIKEAPTVDIPALANIPTDNFSTDYFKYLNVVFVLDISSSMKMGEKMDLMKYSLNQLVAKLRPTDVMGIVTYANTAQVFQQPITGVQKEELTKSIAAIKPLGMTAGGKGIKLGYKQVIKNFSPEKSNMVIIITDGAFNKDSDDYQKTVKKYAKKGIIFSVVGIQPREKDATLMTEAAAFGKGRYIPIHKLADAHVGLVNEVRIATFKK